MKKHFIIIGILWVSLAVLASCAGKPVVWDDRFPEEDLCEIYFEAATIKSYNGIPVSGKGWNTVLSYSTIKIPAGNNEFMGDFMYKLGNTTYKFNGIIFDYPFEAGKLYTVALRTVQEGWVFGQSLDWAIKIYSYEETMHKNGTLAATIPINLR